ncbi:MAG TPA: ATPase [Bacteroidales bacterium]|nr:ATPase [Bacteroidales bacterium]HOK74567.1 ATPase [Bacteroidales bacterium]HOM40947.1 ATPase [Bacteroidales bacterium]HOU30412.1 ATPase [Bacteroidales bacterium]HPP93581.1 ATPase [Bacteroidales bacterium]
MILIADSGSTKTEWKVIEDGVPGDTYLSSGINPYFLGVEKIVNLLKTEIPLLENREFNSVWFYGSGCNTEVKKDVIRDALSRFVRAGKIFVESDLLGAARALCQNEPGIACIIGTGSNSCYYDGKEIVSNVAPLGYILGDEGGAAVLGRKLLSAVLKKQVSQEVIDRFFKTYEITPAQILENVYSMPFPNRFLGGFASFISSNIDMPELQEIVRTSFDEFIKRNILQYPQSKELPVHFTGSIAWNFKIFLEELLVKNSLKPGKFLLHPMPELVKFHIKNIDKL